MPDTNLDDIALFFSKNGKTASCFIPRSVYADPANQLPAAAVEAYWPKAALLEEGAQGQKPYFVTNLALLEDPGVSPVPNAAPTPVRATTQTPAAGDLVVFPWNDPGSAYLVKKATYEDESKCPPLSDALNSDLVFMALTEGVVLANLPKHDPEGVTCYLLNLLALRSYP